MLVEVKKLKVDQEGYRRNISLTKVYINVNSIISIVDYEGIKDFLISEAGTEKYLDKQFSLIKINEGPKVNEIIALGSAQDLYSSFDTSKRGLLNG